MARTFQRPTKDAPELLAIAAEEGPAAPPEPPKKDVKPAKKKTGKKLTLHLSWELDFRLDNLAGFKRMSKAAFAQKLIDQGCGGYGADKNLRQVFAEISGQDREVA